ncbi:MAG TPA: amidohydrolase [Phaeodactylibacter sp.]|nr:amidohydrolase [Phaeodactylibacter sp.]
MLIKEIKTHAENIFPKVVAIRRHLHQHPELSFQEVKTGKFIAEKLTMLKIPHSTGWAQNGVVAIIQGEGSGYRNKIIALRADIDALPITEANDVPYKSKNEGIMHACGHDVHTASVLGAAMILNKIKKHFSGKVKIIFQPAEEKLPGGASILIKEGVLKKPKPSVIFGQHVHPPLEVGKVGFCPGQYMASADELYMSLKGKGGHAALPQDCIDPLVVTAQIILALQQLVSRQANPLIPSVLTFGKINSVGGATNVIPNEIKLQGTFRTMDEKWRKKAHKQMQRIAQNIAKAYGATCDLEIVKGYPSLFNDPELTHKARSRAVTYLGEKNVVDLPKRMTAEDFAYYSQQIPACFYRLGTGNTKKGITSPVHTTTFDVDENCLKLATGLMAWLTVCQLNE